MTISAHLLLFTLILLFLSSGSAMALCIKSEKVNLRNGPGTKHQKIWEVYQYMPFNQLRTKGDWYQVQDVDGDSYWVYAPLTTKDYQCAVVKNNKTNLREGPGTQYPIVSWAPVDKYFSMKVLKTQRDWVHVKDAYGDTAWIYRPLVWIY
jgi:SH3-like domain-containing protein